MAHGPVNNFLCGVVVVFFNISVTDCQLGFQAQQTLHGVGLLCSVGDLGSTNFFHLDSLLIFKLVAGKLKVIASLSSYYGHDDPVSHLKDAQVTGHLSNEDTFGGYLRIIWDHYQDDVDGDYICRLNGVDEDFIPLSLTEELSFQVKTMCPCFGTTPQVLRVGLTEELEATCYIPDPPAINISRLASLGIIMIRNGMKQILAEINSLTGTAIKDGPGVGFVNGSLDGRNTFLRLVLENPTAEMASGYICEGSGVGVSGDPVFFSRSVNVSLEVPDSEELIQRLFELYDVQKELKRCQEERDRLTTTLTTPVTTSPTTTITTPVTTSPTITPTTPITTPTTTFSLTTKKSIFPRSCEDANLPVGQNVITIQPDDRLGTMDVLCEVVTPQEIWTLFQKRFNGSVSFYRSFNEYKNGFGNVHGEFWLGLDNTRRLLLQNNDNNQVKFDLLEDETLIPYTKTYPVFSIGRGNDYILNISGGGIDREYYGIHACIGQIFSTYDHGYTTVAGSSNRAAGWWFPTLGGYVNINGIWGLINPAKSMYWYEFRMSWYYPMTKTEIKFRRNN